MIGQIAFLLSVALDWQGEFCGRSVPFEGKTYFAEQYLVVEVTVKPDRAKPVNLSAGQFRLRVVAAGKKKEVELPAATAGMVASSMRFAALELARQSPFPNQNRNRNRMPNPDAPATEMSEAVAKAALGEGPTLGDTKGLLYFEWPGKLKDIRKLDLVWDAPTGERVLNLVSR